MEDLDAPQWADFIAPSPQIPLDDYFLHRHLKHEYREKLDSLDTESPNIAIKKLNQSKIPLSDTSSSSENILQKTPVRKMVSKGPKNSSARKNAKETTTYENVLTEAMNNLQLSFKKMPNEKSFNKSCLIDSPAFKTPSKRVTRSMCAQSVNTPRCNLEESYYASPENEKLASPKNEPDLESHEENKENVEHAESRESTEDSPLYETSQINLEVTATSTEHEISHEKSEPESEPQPLTNDSTTANKGKDKETSSSQLNSSKQLPKSRVVTAFSSQPTGPGSGSKKKVATLTGNAWHRQVKRRMSITNQRRKSVSKAPSAATKYVSMAEAVTKFQCATPQRFRSTNVKSTRTEQLRRMSLKLTRAHSPALMSKNRNRPVTALSREEQEKLEVEKMRQNQIKANPVRKDILQRPAPLKKVEKKMVTNPEPFHLTKTKKEQFPPPKQGQEIKRVNSFNKKTVPSIVNDDKGFIVKDEEVMGFGIPLEPCKTKKKNTKVQPFSFEARNKELEMKKQERLKKMQESEQQKNKAEFHARPVPSAVKTPANKQASKNDSVKKTKITITRSVSFESKVKLLQQKKEEKIKQMLEEEKKARTFKAQKVPEFKPVLVRGRSRDNLLKRSNENLASKSHNTSDSNKKPNNSLKNSRENLVSKPKNFIKKPMPIPFVAPKKTTPPTTTTTVENQENRSQGAVPKIMAPKCKLSQKSVAVLSELNTDIRAKQRKEFDDQLKKKEMEEEEMRRREEEDRISKEKAQNLELRKMSEVKARPMPVYKPLQILKSKKPVTDPHSPAWARKKSTQ
ncbi:hypothetical protein TSAR_002951 [Trichomalopsis sarcophagae]|uniref:TPX2 C-terminal domain-containing protein n=1 Tax=Trichomalopsis sarcophagae TaxID=543379 RepID=A0A232FNM3_9HYME|nr:hypothetical protein TSAR_002951 [Trichomalopsis sarcophagae]